LASQGEPESRAPAAGSVQFGVRANWRQFVVLSLITFWVGSVVGVERVVAPAIGSNLFHVASYVLLLSFIVSFGFVKAAVNLVAGAAADRFGRRQLLALGWVVALPVPFILATAPDWGWIVAVNTLVGVNQGLAWSMAVTSKIDIAGPRQRGLAAGLNEFAGYAGVAIGGLVGGILAGVELRAPPAEFLLAVVLAGLFSSIGLVRETRGHAEVEARGSRPGGERSGSRVSGLREAFAEATWRDRRLAVCSQAGLIEKFVDTMAWGVFPVFLLGKGYSLLSVGILTGIYAGSWAILQLVFGPLSDRWGRRWIIAGGMVLAGGGVLVVGTFTTLAEEVAGALLAGTGMAMLYPTLIAAVADIAPPAERGAVLGVYRFWRDSGYGFGGLAIGGVADLFGFDSTFLFATALMVVSSMLIVWGLRGDDGSGALGVRGAVVPES
jgi:MFS family permease